MAFERRKGNNEKEFSYCEVVLESTRDRKKETRTVMIAKRIIWGEARKAKEKGKVKLRARV